jgi:uncharacterized protein YbaR (Trm112 family)
MKTKCYACVEPRPLTVEHIIPQAIGGKLTARLYCKECNETFGSDLDNEISKQFGWVGTLLNIKRERGKVQPYEVTDVKSGTKLLFDGKKLKRKEPIVKVVSKDGKKLDSADVTARTEEELKIICTSIQRRYDIADGIKTSQDESPGPTEAEHIMMIDNSLLRRAVSKIAYGFLCVKLPKDVILSSSFDDIRLYIKEPSNIELASANYRNTGFMTDNVRPIHKIHVTFNRGQGILIGFVSIFGIYRFTILLSEGLKSEVEWPDLDFTFDPVRQKEVFGNDNFRAPQLMKEDILRPKQSKELVLRELDKGYKAFESYSKIFSYLGGDLSK